MNLTGNIFKKNVDLEESQIRGFLSLNKSKIMGKLNIKRVNVLDLQERTGKIVGNFYFSSASANEIIIENSISKNQREKENRIRTPRRIAGDV
jgi:hypothetical protein